jgi:hypothetical protein
LGGKKYFLSFIDEKTRFKWEYLINTRDKTYGILKKFIRYIETQYGKTPKTIRSENAGKYTSGHLQYFLREKGVVQQTTVPYTPQIVVSNSLVLIFFSDRCLFIELPNYSYKLFIDCYLWNHHVSCSDFTSTQINGTAERFNRTLLNSVRAMLNEIKLPKAFKSKA